MVEQAIPTRLEKDERGGDEIAELREELARSREEVLRLRDLLIARDAELGEARGRAAELEAGVARLLDLGAALRARVPSFVWVARARLRSQRGPRG